MTQHDDRVYYHQMIDFCQEAIGYLEGVSKDEFAADRLRQRGLIYVVQIIGEAAKRISGVGRARISEIPWSNVIGMRNKRVHEYGEIDINEVWRTVKDNLPPLIRALEQALKDDERADEHGPPG